MLESTKANLSSTWHLVDAPFLLCAAQLGGMSSITNYLVQARYPLLCECRGGSRCGFGLGRFRDDTPRMMIRGRLDTPPKTQDPKQESENADDGDGDADC